MTRRVFWGASSGRLRWSPRSPCEVSGVGCGVPGTAQWKFSSLTGDSFGWSRSPFYRCPLLPNCSCAMWAFNNAAPRLWEDVQAWRVLVQHCSWQAFTHKNHSVDIGRGVRVNQLVLIFMNKLDIAAGSRFKARFQSKCRPRSFLWPDLHPVLWQRSCLYPWHGAFIKDLKSILQTKADWIVAPAELAKRWIETVSCFSPCPVYPDHCP